MREQREADAPVRPWQVFAISVGMGCLIIALLTPVDVLAGELLWVHMAQYMALMSLAAQRVLRLGAAEHVRVSTSETAELKSIALIFEYIQTEGVAELSYLIGDDEEGVAAVFDPRADVDCCLELARAKLVALTHLFGTQIHVGLVSTGYTRFAGYLVGGMKAWNNDGRPLEAVGQMPVHEIKRAEKKQQVVDVRSLDEWNVGPFPTAAICFSLKSAHSSRPSIRSSGPRCSVIVDIERVS